MSQWIMKRKGGDYKAVAKELNIDPLLVRLLLNRNIDTLQAMDEYLYAGRDSLYSFTLLSGINDAKEIILDKVKSKAKIRVIGDYDVDGVCATAILLKGLKFIGADVDHYIPNRFKDGYGLNVSIIESAKADGVDTIITCDNGISAFSQVNLAKEYGMTVIVTDHHEVPFEEVNGEKKYIIPEADAVVDPKLPDDQYPFKEICGAFVAYKLIESLCTDSELLDELIQYAALATVADVMDLISENRILLKTGIELINSKPSVGLKALIELNDIKNLSAYHFGFILGPSINAAGRLEDADYALSLLMENDAKKAVELAERLKSLNERRKEITEKNTEEAIEKIENSDLINHKVIVAALDDCHEGVIGIVAGRLKEKYVKPVLVVTKHDGVYKGSGRSIDNYNLYEEINRIGDLFIKYGGHKGAAGFSFEFDKLDAIREALNSNCTLTESDFVKKFYIDGDIPFSYCSLNFVSQLNLLEPFGNGNESVVFARNDVTILSARFFGQERMVGKYKILDGEGKHQELVLFRRNDEFKEFLTDRYGLDETNRLFDGGTVNMPVTIAYYPSINEYNGYKTVQFVVIDYK